MNIQQEEKKVLHISEKKFILLHLVHYVHQLKTLGMEHIGCIKFEDEGSIQQKCKNHPHIGPNFAD